MVCEYLENLKNSNKLNNYVIDYYLKMIMKALMM